jgi:ABC-type branched-subunit amino acid transport system substrate-binding protein
MKTISAWTVIGLALCLNACGNSSSDKRCDEDLAQVKVGVLLGISEEVATGELWTKAILMAVEAVNKEGGIGGHCLEVDIKDSESSKTVALPKAVAFIQDPSVLGLITNTSAVTACILLSEYAKVDMDPECPPATEDRGDPPPILCQGCTAPDFDVFPLPDYNGAVALWRTMESNTAQGKALAKMAYNDGHKSAGTYAIDLPFGTALAGTFAAEFVNLGGTSEADWQKAHAPAGEPDLGADLASIFETYSTDGKPEALAINSFPDFLVPIMNAWGAQNAPGHLYMSFTAHFQGFVSATSGVSAEDYGRVKGVTYSLAPGLGGDQFAADYEQVAGQDIVPLVASSYDAVMAIALAAVASGKENPTRGDVQKGLQAINDPSGELIGYQDYAKAVEVLNAGGTINFQGVCGDLDWDPAHNNSVKTDLEGWSVENESFVPFELD